MDIEFGSEEVEKQCTGLKAAKKLLGGDELMAQKLLARINAIRQSTNLNDIIVQHHFYFHNLENKGHKRLDGYFSIAVKTKKEPWRIILRPLDENRQPYDKCNIDEISKKVTVIEIKEVSKHYE